MWQNPYFVQWDPKNFGIEKRRLDSSYNSKQCNERETMLTDLFTNCKFLSLWLKELKNLSLILHYIGFDGIYCWNILDMNKFIFD